MATTPPTELPPIPTSPGLPEPAPTELPAPMPDTDIPDPIPSVDPQPVDTGPNGGLSGDYFA